MHVHMKDKLLMTVAAVALLAGTGLASAQGQKGGAEPAAKMDQGAKPDQGKADHGAKMDQGAPGAPGAAAQGADEGKAKAKPKGTAQMPSKSKSAEQPAGVPKSVQSESPNKGGMAAEETKRPATGPIVNERSRTEMNKTVEGRQGGSASVTLSADQRTKLHGIVIKESNAPRVATVDFKLAVGTVVPKTVHVVPVPATFVEIQPTWRGFMYFLVGDQIVIVEPGTLRIVAVIAA